MLLCCYIYISHFERRWSRDETETKRIYYVLIVVSFSWCLSSFQKHFMNTYQNSCYWIEMQYTNARTSSSSLQHNLPSSSAPLCRLSCVFLNTIFMAGGLGSNWQWIGFELETQVSTQSATAYSNETARESIKFMFKHLHILPTSASKTATRSPSLTHQHRHHHKHIVLPSASQRSSECLAVSLRFKTNYIILMWDVCFLFIFYGCLMLHAPSICLSGKRANAEFYMRIRVSTILLLWFETFRLHYLFLRWAWLEGNLSSSFRVAIWDLGWLWRHSGRFYDN